jgi:uncharacterized protein (TIGR00251 family)
VRLTPKSSKDAIEGTGTDDAGRVHLKVRVRAVPENGAANKALCETIAAELGVPKRAVELVAGATQRTKTLRIAGEPSVLLAKLEHLAGGSG